jgi:hypothetical protein
MDNYDSWQDNDEARYTCRMLRERKKKEKATSVGFVCLGSFDVDS